MNDYDYMLIGYTPLPPAPVGRVKVMLPEPIYVQTSDFIGIFYDRSADENIVAQAQMIDDHVDSTELYQVYEIDVS